MKPRILIVDDLQKNLLATASLLEELDAELVLADNGQEALLQIMRGEFSVILLDAHMPDLDGFEILKLMNGVKKTKHIPIIFISAVYKDEQHLFEGYDLGAVDYLVKPFNPQILLAKVKVFLELHRHKETIRKKDQELKLFRNLIDRTDDEILIFDPQTGLLLDANATAVERLGLSPPFAPFEMTMPDCRVICPQGSVWRDVVREVRHRDKLLVEGGRFNQEGKFRHTEANLQLLTQNDKEYLLAVVRDVTERKETEAYNLRLQHAQRANYILLHTALEQTTLTHKLHIALDTISTVPWLKVQAKGAIFILNEKNNTLELAAQRNVADDDILNHCTQIPLGHCLCGQAAQEKRIIFSADFQAEPHHDQGP
ncbi:MAG: response regulator, partial [Magnetococcales bacterium]|nr:response regulator [Magnetococcales bacterium]